jgi:hypothetical protein
MPRAAIAGVLFLLAIASGIWLGRWGRPLPAGLFAAHKLLGVGAVILFGITAAQRLRIAVSPRPILFAAGLVALVVTGAILGIQKHSNPPWLWAHRAATVLALAAAALLRIRT